jgi:hypothetical protein
VRNTPSIATLMRKDMADALSGNEKAKARQIALALRLAVDSEDVVHGD